MTSLVMLTTYFPYEGGEQFIEAEIEYWKNTQFQQVYILPSLGRGGVKDYPKEIKILDVEFDSGLLNKIKYLLLALLSIYFWKEIFYIFFKSKKKGKFKNINVALRNCAVVLRYSSVIAKKVSQINDEIFIYSYWNDYSYYAACLLKKRGLVKKVISRTHGFDLYEERRENDYMPFKWQFRGVPNKIFTLSEKAKLYYINRYNYDQNDIAVARLGVNIPNNINLKKSDDTIKLLSISYCVSVKRLDRIISGIEAYLTKHPLQRIEWTHIGDGPLYKLIKSQVYSLEGMNENFKAHLLGQLSNTDVHKYLANNYFDIFINTSESEGIPVSIMEAMSYKIPTIAGDIGGISELVNGSTGYLMSSASKPDEIVKGIELLYGAQEYRNNSQFHILDKFNANTNFINFIQELEQMALLDE